MDKERKAEVDGQLDLLSERLDLCLRSRAVSVKIEACFADGTDVFGLRQLSEVSDALRVQVLCMVWMDAGGGTEDLRIPLRKLDGLPRDCDVGARDDHEPDVGQHGAREHLVEPLVRRALPEVDPDVDDGGRELGLQARDRPRLCQPPQPFKPFEEAVAPRARRRRRRLRREMAPPLRLRRCGRAWVSAGACEGLGPPPPPPPLPLARASFPSRSSFAPPGEGLLHSTTR
mmetsp:Transcript_8891/g.21871  ORF Transcript_8891/g.21871 Transcript_8891/m.21871 type:complete len:230 (+) Transcript_8891:2632-3321(+)